MTDNQNSWISPDDWADFGLGDVAYVRKVTVNGKPAFAAISADGKPMFAAPSREAALAALEDQDVEAVTLH